MTRLEERLEHTNKVEEADTFEEEQEALEHCALVDIVEDLPGDSGKCWALRPRIQEEDEEDYHTLCQELRLPVDRGSRIYYATRGNLTKIRRELSSAGFCIAFSMDATRALCEEDAER